MTTAAKVAGLVAVMIAGSGAPAVPTLAAESRPATASTKQVTEGLAALHREIRAWRIEYQATAPDLPFYVHRTLAAKYPDSCFYQGAKGPADFDWQSDTVGTTWKDHPFQDWVLVTPTENYWGKPWNREYGSFPLSREAPLPDKMRTEVLFLALGWWTFEKRPSPTLVGGAPRSVPDILKSGRYSVAAGQELCQGVWCHVLQDPGRDRLWIDCDRNFALVAREISDITTGATVARVEMSRHREDRPGIWVPREIRNIQFNHRAPTPEGWRQRLIDSRVRILDVRLNDDVDGSIFQPEPLPPGAIVLHTDGRYEQARPGGVEQLDRLAGWLESRYAARGPDEASDRSATLDHAVLIAGAGLLAAGLGWRATRAARNRSEEARRLSVSRPAAEGLAS